MKNLSLVIVSGLRLVFPSNRIEVILFILSLFLYGFLGICIALDYSIIYDDRIPWDAYFSFDNRAIITTGGGFERHPLANYFFDFLRNGAFWVSQHEKNEVFRAFWAILSAVMISLTLIQVFKYLTKIIGLETGVSTLLLVFFGLFSTNILLSFTPETYTFSLFFLTLLHHYSAKRLQQGKEMGFVPLVVFGVAISGLTITNGVKTYLPLLFEKNLFRSWRKLGYSVLRVAVSVGVFVFLFLYRIQFQFVEFLTKTGQQYEKFSEPKVTPVWDMMISWFFGGNTLFPSFVLRDYHTKKGFEYKALFMDTYSSSFSYAFVGILLFLVLFSWVRNYKNPLIHLLGLSFLVDIVIHCVLKFGLHTSYIYGGHFVFVYPLFLGWLLHFYRKKDLIFMGIVSCIVILSVYLGMNNFYRMQEFFVFLETYYSLF